jgi:hypothetical protein
MQTKSSLIGCVFYLFLTSCSGGGSGGGPGSSPYSALDSCNHVVTDDKINSFNQKQTAFSVTSGGASVYCKAEVNENGRVRKVEVSGRSVVRVLPGLRYLRTETQAGPNPYLVYMEKSVATEDDAKSILSQMGLPFVGGASPNYEIDSNNYPSYVRFGKGALFYIQNAKTIEVEKQKVIVFGIEADSDQLTNLKRLMPEFLRSAVPLEVLWYPRIGMLARQFADENQIPVVWSQISAESTLISMVRDHDGASSQVITRAIQLVDYWNLNVGRIDRELPELYNYAFSQWRNPSIADNTASALLTQLRYIVKVDPASSLKPTLDTYELINKYQGSTANSLRSAVDYVAGKLWTKDQFDLLLAVSENLYESLGSRTWELALAINQRTNYDRPLSVFAAKLGMMLKKRSMVRDSGTSSIVEAIFAKIQLGMTNTNLDLYFNSYDYFETELRANRSDAETACDELVFSKKLTGSNQSLYFSFLKWLKDSVYVNFSESYSVVKSLSESQSLDVVKVDLFKQVFTWLKDSVYLNKSIAISKAGNYVGKNNFALAVFNQLKSYFEWLTGSIYLNRTDALQRAEDAIVTGGLQSSQVDAIKSLTAWYIESIYLNRAEALKRSEALVVVKKISPAQLVVMKDVVSWLVSDIYINRTEAATKGETYVSGASPLTADRAQQLKSYTSWLISDMYLNRPTALGKAENFILTLGFDNDQINAMKSAASWLVSEVYVNRTEALAKGETYLNAGNLTKRLFEALKEEYNAQIELRKPRAEALKIAEKKVLKL